MPEASIIGALYCVRASGVGSSALNTSSPSTGGKNSSFFFTNCDNEKDKNDFYPLNFQVS